VVAALVSQHYRQQGDLLDLMLLDVINRDVAAGVLALLVNFLIVVDHFEAHITGSLLLEVRVRW
jgi:hypothetical protein